MTLEDFLHTHNIAHVVLTPEGMYMSAETAGERGKLRNEAQYAAKRFTRFLKNQGLGFAQYLGKDPYKFLKYHFGGVGSVRLPIGLLGYNRIVAVTWLKSVFGKSYITNNSLGGGLSEGIDGLMADHDFTRSQAHEYKDTEEWGHALGIESETKIAEKMYHWFMHRATTTKDAATRTKYKGLARVANDRYKMHCQREGKKIKDLGAGHKDDDHAHGGHGHHKQDDKKHDGHEHDNGNDNHSHNNNHGKHISRMPYHQSSKTYSAPKYNPSNGHSHYNSRTPQASYKKAA
jgi:hypothetical protein